MLDVNPATVGVDNPTPRRKEQHGSTPRAAVRDLAALPAGLSLS
jgi:hypothetical protein